MLNQTQSWELLRPDLWSLSVLSADCTRMEAFIRANGFEFLVLASQLNSWSHHSLTSGFFLPAPLPKRQHTAMRRAISVCASFLSALLLLHCILTPSGVVVSKERIQSRKLLQSVLVSSESARRQVFHALAAAANKSPGAQVSENLKKQMPSRSNPIQN